MDLEAGLAPQLPQVLIVDDDLMNVEVFKALLHEKKVPSDTALNGEDAVLLVKQRLKLV